MKFFLLFYLTSSLSAFYSNKQKSFLHGGSFQFKGLLINFSAFFINPFISITPSKPLMLSGSWLTLHNSEIYYLAAVNYDPALTDLIFIRVNICPAAFPHNSRGHYLSRGWDKEAYCYYFNLYILSGSLLPRGLIPQC